MRTLVKDEVFENIERLKKLKNAIVLAHYYQDPAVKRVADRMGDSLELCRMAKESNAEIIVFAGVEFMAQSAKILNPTRTVLLPNREAGCSLAESITAEDVRRLKAQYPDGLVVSYVNTSAEVKAESYACCTSANYQRIIEAVPSRKVIFVPDIYMFDNVKNKVSKELIGWHGECIVHKQFTPEKIAEFKKTLDDFAEDMELLVHIECPSPVASTANFAGSTAGMIKYIQQSKAKRFLILTECDMNSYLQEMFPDRIFQTPCTMCPYMKKITPEGIEHALLTGQYEIKVAEPTREKAEMALDRMLELSR